MATEFGAIGSHLGVFDKNNSKLGVTTQVPTTQVVSINSGTNAANGTYSTTLTGGTIYSINFGTTSGIWGSFTASLATPQETLLSITSAGIGINYRTRATVSSTAGAALTAYDYFVLADTTLTATVAANGTNTAVVGKFTVTTI